MKSYVSLLIETCHKRRIHAMGGMAAQIPIKDNEELNNKALEKVRQDKLREVKAGHDGTWVAHPGLVSIAKEIFDQYMPEKNQIDKKIDPVIITQDDLIKKPYGTITETGFRKNVNIGIQYLSSWLNGNGCVPINNLMEDAATAEICRTQLWQWINNNALTDQGIECNTDYFKKIVNDEREKIIQLLGISSADKIDLAIKLFDKLILSEKFSEFLTLDAYQYIM
jgi:malate synthase